MSFLASFFTIHFLLLLMATLLASARGWRLVPFVLLGLSQIPKLYAHATPLSLDPHDLMTLVMVNGTVMWILYIGLGLMILLPRRDPTKSSLPTILVAVLVASIPWLTLQYLGGELEALTGGKVAADARRATAGDIADAEKRTQRLFEMVAEVAGKK